MLIEAQLHAYNTMVKKIYASADLQELCNTVLQSLQTLVPYHHAIISMIDLKKPWQQEKVFFSGSSKNPGAEDYVSCQKGIDPMVSVRICHKEICWELFLYRTNEDGKFTEEELLILKLFQEHVIEHLARNLISHTSPEESGCHEWSLTRREEQIASLVTKGRTNKQIAQELCVSENTIKTILKRLYCKTGVHSRSELIRTLYKLENLNIVF